MIWTLQQEADTIRFVFMRHTMFTTSVLSADSAEFGKQSSARFHSQMEEMRFIIYALTANQALEPTATRRMLTFQMIKILPVEATLALGGGSSACSR